MHYPVPLRRKIIAHIEEGMSKREAARLFKISRQTLYNWLSKEDLKPQLAPQRHRKIDKAKLLAHVKANPKMLLRERAEVFNVSISGLSQALKSMNIVKKTKSDI